MNQRHSYRIFIFEWLTLHFTKFTVSEKEVDTMVTLILIINIVGTLKDINSLNNHSSNDLRILTITYWQLQWLYIINTIL